MQEPAEPVHPTYHRGAAGLAIMALAGTVYVTSGPAALWHVLFYALAVLPGLPVGLAMFGAHAVGWLSGAAFGYALTALALWAASAMGATTALPFVLAWMLCLLAAWGGSRLVRRPLVHLPVWRRPDSRMLVLVVLLALTIFVFPYRNLGVSDSTGTRQYRAYFTADFLWHVALTAELAKLDGPPANPYMGDQPVHYYWTYFQFPAVVTALGPRALRDTEVVLKANAICTGALMLAIIAVVTWCAVPHALPVFLAVMLAAIGASAEGAYAVYDLWARGQPLAALRGINVDAISNWYFGGLRIDGIARSMWYTPQHAMAVSLGLLALPIAGTAGAAAPAGAIVAAGVLLGASTLFNPLIGGILSLVYGTTISIGALGRPRRLRRLPLHALAAVPVLAAVGWSALNGMFEGAGGTVEFGVRGFARSAPLTTLSLSLGPLLAAAILGACPPWRLARPLWPAGVACAAGFAVLFGVRLSVEESYVGFRAGQILLATLPVFAAGLFARGLASKRARRATLGLALALTAIGAPTTIIDTFNAQDVENRAMGPGFRWTIPVSPSEQEAFAWIRRATPTDALVQPDVVARARDTWTQIPTFAHRRMAAGLPISLLNTPEYASRSNRVRRDVFATTDASTAWDTCRQMGINYVYVGGAERGAHPETLAKFDAASHLFLEVFRNHEATIYAVVPPGAPPG